MTVALFAAAAVLSFSTSALQLRWVNRNAPNLLEAAAAYQAVLNGTALAPERFRVLTPLMISGVADVYAAAGRTDPEGRGFLLFRWMQHGAILLCAAFYYRRLGLSTTGVFVAMSALAWALSQSRWDPDFALSAHTELVCFLFAAWCVARGRPGGVVLVALFAAANRETAVLLPLVVLATELPEGNLRTRVPVFALACGAYLTVQVSLHVWLAGEDAAGLAILRSTALPSLYAEPWLALRLAAPWSIVPILACVGWTRWPPLLRRFAVLIAPLWLVGFLWAGAPAGVAHLLLPQALVFIPAAVCIVDGTRAHAAVSPA